MLSGRLANLARRTEGAELETKVNWRRCGALTLQAVREAGVLRTAVVVLIGSYARQIETWRSDVDILVLLRGNSFPKLKAPFGTHLHVASQEQFVQKVDGGDDYAISAVRYGALLYDRLGFWAELRRRLDHTVWPDWRNKIGHAKRRLALGDDLLEMGDLEAATEEYLFAATQIARAILLRNKVYPLSRPELSDQLVFLRRSNLAAELRDLIRGDLSEEQLREVAKDLKTAANLEETSPR